MVLVVFILAYVLAKSVWQDLRLTDMIKAPSFDSPGDVEDTFRCLSRSARVFYVQAISASFA